MEQDLSAQVAERAASSGISHMAAHLLITGTMLPEGATRPPKDEEVRAYMDATGLSQRVASQLIRQVMA